MEGFVKGDVVVLPFPFSDLSANKRRPALVLASGEYDDVILCQITSKNKKGIEAIEINEKDLQGGKLNVTSYARPRKLFTSDSGLILYKAGKIRKEKVKEVENAVCNAIRE